MGGRNGRRKGVTDGGEALRGRQEEQFDLGQNADINVTPFVDVMLVLLIIFMVTAPLATVSIKIDIPPAQGADHAVEAADLHLDRQTTASCSSRSRPARPSTEMHPTTLDTMAASVAQSLGVRQPDHPAGVHPRRPAREVRHLHGRW